MTEDEQQALDASIDQQLDAEELPPQIGQQLRDAIQADLAPLRPRSVAWRSGLVLAAGLACGLFAALSYAVHGFALGSEHAAALLLLLGVAAAAAGAQWLGFAPRLSKLLGGGDRRRLVLTGLLLTGWAGYVLMLVRDHAHDATLVSNALHGRSLACAGHSLLAGVAATGLFMWIWRNSDPVAPRSSGALIGLAAGCVASAGVSVACGSPQLGHLLIGHLMALPLLALAGAAAGRRVLAP